ncbi:MAG: hypothetical protein R3F53_16975 [Gammaproteobacteria bacterium]
MARRELLWLRDVALYWDLMNASWNEVVLAYGPTAAKDSCLAWVLVRSISPEMMIATVILLSLVGCGAWMRLLWRNTVARSAPGIIYVTDNACKRRV